MMAVVDDNEIRYRARALGIDPTADNLRDLVATETERRFGDVLDAWEVRHGRNWNFMTRDEAEALAIKHPRLMHKKAFRDLFEDIVPR